MNKAALSVLVTLLGASVPAMASEKLAQDKQCVQCHAMNKDGAGPSFVSIATQWKGKKGAEAKLVATIRRGSRATGGPHWGKATMPDPSERPLVSEREAHELARWILSQAQ